MGFRTSPVAITVPFDNATNGFAASEVQTAIEEAKATAEGKARFSIQLVNNGTLANNQRFGYDSLLPNAPIVVPRNCILRELTFSNAAANSDARFDIYRRSIPATTNATTGATLLQQWTITNQISGILSGMNHSFNAGEELLIIFVDTGDNPTDAVMAAFFQVS